MASVEDFSVTKAVKCHLDNHQRPENQNNNIAEMERTNDKVNYNNLHLSSATCVYACFLT